MFAKKLKKLTVYWFLASLPGCNQSVAAVQSAAEHESWQRRRFLYFSIWLFPQEAANRLPPTNPLLLCISRQPRVSYHCIHKPPLCSLSRPLACQQGCLHLQNIYFSSHQIGFRSPDQISSHLLNHPHWKPSRCNSSNQRPPPPPSSAKWGVWLTHPALISPALRAQQGWKDS